METFVFSFDAAQALRNIRPNCSWSLNGNSYEGLEWFSDPSEKPTLEEIETECKKLVKEYEKLEYSRNRIRQYQKNGIDSNKLIIALWEKIVEGNDIPANLIQEIREQIKSDYPKPE